jgi:CheY-like chemotaxis protein
MDVQMPTMDGLEATRRIRADPHHTGLAVVALTANAYRDDHIHCFEAGMDAVLTKPIDPEQLLATLLTLVGRPASVDAASVPPEKANFEEPPKVADSVLAELPVWDRGALARAVGKNPAIHQSLLRKFLHDAEALVAATDVCIAAARYQDAAAQAHKLKSSARTVGAMRLGACCAALEQAGGDGRPADCAALSLLLRQELARAEDEIAAARQIPSERLQGE